MGGVPSKPDPSCEVQVINAGLSRTGTVSMQLAFQKLLDGPVYHGGTHCLAGKDADAKKWVQYFEERRAGNKEQALKLLREVTAGYVAYTDSPICLAVDDMVELYPNAKVVLVTRDPERWWKSYEAILVYCQSPFLPFLAPIWPTLRWFPALTSQWVVWVKDVLRDAGKPPVFGPEIIKAHNEQVMKLVPKEKLLVMEVKDGWGPLCKFMGKPIPDEPFPRLNDADEADRVGRRVFAKLALAWLGFFAITGGAIYSGWKFLMT